MRRVLSVASVLERIDSTLVLAAMASDPNVSRRRVDVALTHAEDAGIVSRTSSTGRWLRFHPLVRDFMLSRLLENTGRQALLEMHLRVAAAAEPIDWAASAHHYIEAEHHGDAMRVLRESAIEALGTASWGAATALADRMPDQPVPEAVSVIRAYGYVAHGQARRAVRLLEGLTPPRNDAMAWGLTHAALAKVYLITGQLEGVRRVIGEMSGHEDLAPVLVSLARGTSIVLATHEGGPLADASEVLEDLANEHARLGLTYFAGVSFHNAALAAYARGRYGEAIALGQRAVKQFDLTSSKEGVESTHALVAQAHLELGNAARAAAHLEYVADTEPVLADAQADAAWMSSAQGDNDTAWALIEAAAATTVDGGRTPGAHAAVLYSRALAHLVDGNPSAADQALDAADEASVELDAKVRHLAIGALVALQTGRLQDAGRLARDGLDVASRQGAMHWARWLRLLSAVAESDSQGFRRALVSLSASAKLSTLVLADAVVLGLGLIGEAPDDVLELMRVWPARWLPALRRVVQGSDRASGMVAADLLSTLGTIDDVVILAAFERRHIRQPARRTYSRRLARHANPTMVVHDLGRIRLQLGQRVVPLSQSRRKAASLVAYLASRPSHSAARDQVLDAIWPNQSPEGAANSLHQTLYFLRRDIDPWFEDGHSVDYLVVEPDVVYLDPELVQVDSAAFFRQVTAAVAGDNIADVAIPLLRDYQARFALDFEYEEWSLAWRDQLHALFLEAVQATATALQTTGRYQLAADIVEKALAIDPSALELEATLVVALHRSGATAAAAHQYSHFARAYEEEASDPPPSLIDLLAMHPERSR
jgi:DNA-binding SARP family transcriptional activator